MLVEVWDGGRWRMIDSELRSDFSADDGAPLDRLDLRPDRFLTTAQAWLAAKAGSIDPARVVVAPDLELPDTRGWPQLAHDLLHDIAALNGIELLLWQDWGASLLGDALPQDVLELLDRPAQSVAEPEVSLAFPARRPSTPWPSSSRVVRRASRRMSDHALASGGVSQLYDLLGSSYGLARRPDPRIARVVEAAIGDARSIINVGAGTGSYEPDGRHVVAVEPSAAMRARRAASAAPCVVADAEALPFDDASVDLAMGTYTDFHWADRARGVAEMVRVARDAVVLLTVDSATAADYWLIRDYFPSGRGLFGSLDELLALLPDEAEVWPVPIPGDCRDGFVQAFWKRPHELLDPAVRSSMALFAHLDTAELEAGLRQLASDLRDGSWLERNADLLHQPEADLGHRLVRWRRHH